MELLRRARFGLAKQEVAIAYISATSAVAVLGVVYATGAIAQSDPFRITPYEKAACAADAARFCAQTYPDETRLLGCMVTYKSSLSPVCKAAFTSGLKRRHLDVDAIASRK